MIPGDRPPTTEAPIPGGFPLDAHLHTELSPDSSVPIDVYAASAAERSVAEIAITDHLDFTPGAPAYRHPGFAARERYVRGAAERWSDRVAIRFGVEITYERSREGEIREFLRRHRFDYVIGSVHVYAGSVYEPDRVAGHIAGRSLGDILEPYLVELGGAIRSRLFDTIGHFDYVKRYLFPHITPAQLARAPELYEETLRELVMSGAALEVNTSGLRQSPGETYPSPAIVAHYRELGGARVTVGSDAHRPEWFAFGLEEGYAAVARAGFEALSVRRDTSGFVAVPVPRRLLRRGAA
ncbi:MAG TPA: histidinol-phosphatase HisJ family protein [Candidatus Limnocylindrales bacterium]